MRTLAAVVVLGIVGASSLAFADAWRANAVLQPESPTICREADVSKLFFDLTGTGSELSVKTADGQMFSAPVADDGSFTTTITAPVGAKKFTVDLTGNATTRDLEAFNKEYLCRFKLIPIQ
jgi:hypothetical protein